MEQKIEELQDKIQKLEWVITNLLEQLRDTDIISEIDYKINIAELKD